MTLLTVDKFKNFYTLSIMEKKNSHEKKESKKTERREKVNKTESEYRKDMLASYKSNYKNKK